MTKIMKSRETQEGSSVRKMQERIQQGKDNLQNLSEVAPEQAKGVLPPSPLDQLVLASKIDDTIHQLISRLEKNTEIMKNLVKITRTAKVLKTVDARSNLGIQLLKLVNSHVQLDTTGPLVQTRWEVRDGELKPISPEGPKTKKK